MTYFSQKKERLQYLRSILSGAIVKTVILSADPVEKPPALHLILHCRSGMSTNCLLYTSDAADE